MIGNEGSPEGIPDPGEAQPEERAGDEESRVERLGPDRPPEPLAGSAPEAPRVHGYKSPWEYR